MPVVSSMRLSAASARKPATMLSPRRKILPLQAESARLKALVDELDLAQLSANNRQELSRARSSWRKNRASSWMPICRRCAICKTASASGRRKRRWRVPNCWRRTVKTCRRTSPAQFKVNRELSQALNQQAQRMDLVASQQRQATNQTLQVRQALNTLREQSQWLGSSNLLGEALRAGGAAAGAPSPAAAGYGKWRSCACSVCALKIC